MKFLNKQTMPALFIGHGSPMNALAKNNYTEALNTVRSRIPSNPKAILCISAHWLTKGTFISSTDTPDLIYDFYGFPDELYNVKYAAKGSSAIATSIRDSLKKIKIQFDDERGLDHGAWSVLKHIYPDAEIPILQLSIDIAQPPEYHLKLGEQLSKLRDEGILILGSGNIVHNLQNFSWREDEPPFSWAVEFDTWVKQQLEKRDFKALAYDYHKTAAGRLSVPTTDHYLPLLYILGASQEPDRLHFIYENIQNGSIAMSSFIFE